MKIPNNANQLYSGVLVDIYKIPDTDGLWVKHKKNEERGFSQIESGGEVHDTIVDLL